MRRKRRERIRRQAREEIVPDQTALGDGAQKLFKRPQRILRDGNMTAPTPVDLNVATQIPVLHGLKPEALAILLAEASVTDVRPGQALFRQGEPAVAFFIIVDGWIKLYRVTPAGDEAVLTS
jgi:CRP-like cAMP-binding protein